MARIALAEMVEELRKELRTAVEAGRGEEIRFRLGEVTLEAQVEVTREGGGQAGLKFWLAEVGASGSASAASTQTVVLKLQPVDARGGNLQLGR